MTRVAYTLGALIGVASIVAATVATASTTTHAAPRARLRTAPPSPPANESAAQADAVSLLGKLALPTGATPSPTEPAGDGSALADPGLGIEVTPNIVDDHAWWLVPGSRADVLAYIAAHSPAGSTKTGVSDAGVRGVTTSESVEFGWPPIPDVLTTRWLVVEVVQLPNGATGLRADAQVVWVTPRAAAETIPAGTRVLRVSVHRGLERGRPTHRPFSVTSARKIDRVVALLNALPASQPGVRNCPADFGGSVRLEFDTSRSAAPVAVAEIYTTGCGGVGLELDGRRQSSLESEPLPGTSPSKGSLLSRIEHILGVHFNTRP